MADRTSAYLFARIFGIIDDHVLNTETRKRLAIEFWNEISEYDFSPYQMDCDKILTKLGLARRGVDPDYPEDGETTIYGPEETSR